MSLLSSASAAASPAPLRYYCHQCDRDVSIAPPASPDADVLCPLCGGGFVEELPPPDNRSLSNFLFASPPSFDLRHHSDLSAFFGPPSPASPAFDPSNFLHDHFGGLLSSGATIQIVIEGGGGAAPALTPGLSLADYFMGPGGLEQLIQQLAENDPNRYGTPPAAKSAVAALPDVTVSADMMLVDGGAQCAICMDDFILGASAKQLPCKHVFHKDCILPWLELHSSCPVCRFELPTDDPDYQHQHRQSFSSPAPEAPAAAASPRVAERRFRISLPLSLRAAFGGGGGAHAETSNPTAQPHNNDDDEPPSGENYEDHRNTTGAPPSGYDDLD